MQRREFLLGSIGAGVVGLRGNALTGDVPSRDGFAEPAADPIRAALKQTVGAREKVAGMVAVVVDEAGTRMTS
jgi:hypothetical protein